MANPSPPALATPQGKRRSGDREARLSDPPGRRDDWFTQVSDRAGVPYTQQDGSRRQDAEPTDLVGIALTHYWADLAAGRARPRGRTPLPPLP